MEKLRIIIGGFIGLMPAGGVTWDYLQYVIGLADLGHDVTYLEDTRLYPVFSQSGDQWKNCSGTVQYLSTVMHEFGLERQWCYRDEPSGACFGLSESALNRVCNRADIFINISCSTFIRDEYGKIPVRILVDSDPMFTQIQYLTGQQFTPGENENKKLVDAHTHHFTFGEHIGKFGCRIPEAGIDWKTTRQPIILRQWTPIPLPSSPQKFTTIMNWSAGKKLSYEGECWGQKDVEFRKFIHLPGLCPDVTFQVAVNLPQIAESNGDATALQAAGWNILHPDEQTKTVWDYMQFIRSSTGEFSVAKETYVKALTGWFSCRSACYLATGRPVIAQDTGWSSHIPSGEGLFAFDDPGGAASAIASILENPERHSRKARELAVEYFDSNKVLNTLLDTI